MFGVAPNALPVSSQTLYLTELVESSQAFTPVYCTNQKMKMATRLARVSRSSSIEREGSRTLSVETLHHVLPTGIRHLQKFSQAGPTKIMLRQRGYIESVM